TTEPRVRWCDRDDAHPAHERRNQFGGKDYCTGMSEEAAARGRPSPPAPAAEGDAVLDRAAAAFADAWTGVATLRGGVRAALTAAGPIIERAVVDRLEALARELDALTVTHQAENYATVLRIKREGVMEAIRRVSGE